MTTDLGPPPVRPDGTPYRPRNTTLRAHFHGETGVDGHGVIVFGTLDPDTARPFAERAIRYWCSEPDLIATRPEPGWYRDGYTVNGRTWICDARRGSPGVQFTCEEPHA